MQETMIHRIFSRQKCFLEALLGTYLHPLLGILLSYLYHVILSLHWGDSFILEYNFAAQSFTVEVSNMAEVEARQIAILETVEDIQNRRDQVLRRYAEFKEATRLRRQRLEDAKRYHQFKRDADEVEAWINEKLQIACDECYKDPTNLQVTFF